MKGHPKEEHCNQHQQFSSAHHKQRVPPELDKHPFLPQNTPASSPLAYYKILMGSSQSCPTQHA